MSRWEPDAPGRLQRAAIELYGERGYEQTTVAEIAAAAGVTERTFFRHFADKREVFFHGTEQFEQTFLAGIAQAPPDASRCELAMAAVQAAGALLEGRRPFAAIRQRILDDNPELAERELSKLDRIRRTLETSLVQRGGSEAEASLVASAALAVFFSAFERWVKDPAAPALPELIATGFVELGALLGVAAAV